MKTLIFRSNGKPSSDSLTVEFVKEGSFEDAMQYFDDTYPVFYQSDDSENFDSSIDETGYYTDSNGYVIVTDSELKESTEHTCNVDDTFFRNYYTVESNNLSDDELEAIIKRGYDWLIEECVIENGYDYEAYQVLTHFEKRDYLVDRDTWNSFKNIDFIITDEEPVSQDDYEDIDFIEVNSKYYTQN